MKDARFIFLAKLGIIESTDEKGNYDIQRIDDIEDFRISNKLSFFPPQLWGDFNAKKIFESLDKNQLDLLDK